jgi:hypothetical protein
VATVTKLTRKIRGKAYEYHAVRFTDPGTGKERIRYFRSRKEAQRARTEIEGRVATGTYAPDAHKVTVREIAERWRKAAYSPRRADELRSTTVADYETALELYVLPRWGAVRMADIRAGVLETWRNELLEKGVEPGWQPLGASTVRKALLVLGILFRFAMRDHIVAVNPAALVRKPAVRTRKAADERLTPEQLAALFATLSGRTRIVGTHRRGHRHEGRGDLRPALGRRGSQGPHDQRAPPVHARPVRRVHQDPSRRALHWH